MRRVRSYVRRGGRITDAQARAVVELWPRYGIDFTPAVLDLDAVFGRRAERVLEIGFGNGDVLLALAAGQPHRDFLGIEVHDPGVGRVLAQAVRAGLTNLRVMRHDAVEVLEQQIPHESLDEVLIFFPDPWPKKRHHKRRLLQPAFVETLAARLRPGGVLRVATDWEPYAQQILEVLGACARLENCAPDSGFAPRPPLRPLTRFERRGERLGHSVWDLEFRCRAGEALRARGEGS
jgi:tRNA (guanine-N7-)-methyltransferase